MNQFKVVVTDYNFNDLRYEENILSEIPGIELIDGNNYEENELVELIKHADGIISQYAVLDDEIIEQMKKCKIISCYGIGVNTIDIDKATEKGIRVANVPDYCIDEVSDHALTLMLSWARNIIQLNDDVKNNIWGNNNISVHRFKNQTVGILGFGKIPRRLVDKLIVIGFKVLVYDPYVSSEEIVKVKALPSSLEDVFKLSDFISVHTPLTNETRDLINLELFSIAKKSLMIINTSRGPIIKESDLITALQKGLIAGAALDVMVEEPINKDNPLLNMDNVILTPHVGWYSEESEKELREKCTNNVLQVLKNELPPYLVN